MTMPGKKEKTRGGHAVLGVGYDDNSKCFIIKNSWGENWGDKGFFYMPYDYITDSDLCADFWVIQTVS
jgi:C1A family cysteine protease